MLDNAISLGRVEYDARKREQLLGSVEVSMSYVVMNVITMPADRKGEFEERFAKRAGMVATMPGFEYFQLLRPVDDDRYVVYTKWADEGAFKAWLESPAFRSGHASQSKSGPVGTASELWCFEVVQSETTHSQ